MRMIDFRTPIESFEQAVNEVVALMTMQTPAPSYDLGVDVPISYFDGAELYADRYRKWFMDDNKQFLTSATPDILPHIDVTVISDVDGADEMVVTRFRSINRKDARGRVFQVFKRFLYEQSTGSIRYDGKFTSGRNYFTSDDGKHWLVIGDTKRMQRVQPAPPDVNSRLWIAAPIALTQHYEWKVTLGYQGCISIGIPTTPTGCREVFKLRDIPEGKARREALRNFVCEHTRRHPATDDEEARIVVREHLRGSSRFNWNGLRCTIHPAQADLIRLGLTRK